MADAIETAAPAEKPVAKIVTKLPREKVIELTYPVEFNGELYTDISVRRLNGVEVLAYIERSENGYRSPRMPTIDCPDEVFAALDDDDRYKLEAAGIDFLPQRLKDQIEGLREQVDALTSESSEESSPLSPVS